MTLREFFNTVNVYIWCKTKEDADLLCNKFDSMDMLWSSDDTYTDKTYYDVYYEETVYGASSYSNIKYCNDNGLKF